MITIYDHNGWHIRKIKSSLTKKFSQFVCEANQNEFKQKTATILSHDKNGVMNDLDTIGHKLFKQTKLSRAYASRSEVYLLDYIGRYILDL